MMNTNLYTAVGKFHVKGSVGSMRCPLVTIGGREFILDMQEMMLWTVLNWRILTEDEIYLLYEKKVQETGPKRRGMCTPPGPARPDCQRKRRYRRRRPV